MSVLLDCLICGVDLCADDVELAHWWGQNKPALRALDEEEWAAIWRRKEERQAEYRRAFAAKMQQDKAQGDARPSFWGGDRT
jgi:hypothetical protein